MDGNPGYTATLPYVSKDLLRVSSCTILSNVDLDSSGVSNSPFTYGSKRRCADFNVSIHSKDESPLALGLGCSTISCTTIYSGRESEEDSFIDLGLGINICPRDNISCTPKKVSGRTLDSLKIAKPSLDLQLSLSTGFAESKVTTMNRGPSFQNNQKAPVLASTAQLMDKGSTSYQGTSGDLHVPPLQSIHHGRADPNSMTMNFSSSSWQKTFVRSVSDQLNQQSKKRVKCCTFEACTRGARGASGLCIAHGGGRRCNQAGCLKGAEGKTVFCKAHGGGRRCQHFGCTKSAEGRTDYCIGHGGGKRCSHNDCSRASRGKSGLCIRHGGGKRCRMENCIKSAEGISGLCISHGGGRRCQYPECRKGAQGSTMFCKAHGGGRRCTFFGCTKGAEGSTPYCKGHGGGKRCTSDGCTKSVHGGTHFCVKHGGGKRCAMSDCTKSARGRTNYCVRHGGGKRCKFDGCPKSAQGSTDFCKAHGGGKRCCWRHLALEYGGQCAIPCDKFARGKSGLCASHSSLFPDRSVIESYGTVFTSQGSHSSNPSPRNSILSVGHNLSYPAIINEGMTSSTASISHGHLISIPTMQMENLITGDACLNNLSLPEGRVHGGGLMAMLNGGTKYNNQERSGEAESDFGRSEHGSGYLHHRSRSVNQPLSSTIAQRW